MIQRILLLALMSTPNLQDTRSEYLLIKLNSQAGDIKSRTTQSVPVATESPQVVSTTSKFEKKTFQKLNTTNITKAWPTYGTSIVLPSPMFGLSLQSMGYIINPFMSKGKISDIMKRQFANDLHQILNWTSSWLQRNQKYLQNIPKVFEASPIAPSFDIESLLAGVRNYHLSSQDKDNLINIIKDTVNDNLSIKDGLNSVSGYTVIQNYDDILSNIQKYEHTFKAKKNVIKALNSISSGIPDSIYLANAGLNLGKSSVLGNKNVFIIQSPRMVERQVENAFTRALSIQMGSFPIEMKRVYEGMADSVTAMVNFNGEKKPVLLGFNSSRSDPRVYEDVINVARSLKVVPEFPKDVVVLEVNRAMRNHAYHMDVAMITLPNIKVCVGEGILTENSMKQLENLFDKVYIIPKEEWMRFALNSILIDERLGFARKRFGQTPRLAIIPPSTPTLKNVLIQNGYEVKMLDLAYDKGGGFLRCLTLFSNVDTNTNMDNHNTREEYKHLVSKIDQKLSNSTLKSLHWTSEIHALTEKLYALQYKYALPSFGY